MGDRQQFTLEELAAEAGMTPRNVRAYQTRGLMAAPHKQGRRSIYNSRHLRQLQEVLQLRSKGWSLTLIAEKRRNEQPDTAPVPKKSARPGSVPGTFRRRSDLPRTLFRLDAWDEEVTQIVDELVQVRAAVPTGKRTMVTADVASRLDGLHRQGVSPLTALRLAVEAVRQAQTVLASVKTVVASPPTGPADRARAELIAELLGALIRDSVRNSLSTPEVGPRTVVDISEDAIPDLSEDDPESPDGDDDLDLDRGPQR